MEPQGYGRIINIASVAGISALSARSPHYSAAKGAVVGYTRAVALEVAGANVLVNAIAPGGVETPAKQDAQAGSSPRRMRVGEIVRELFVSRAAVTTYLGSGFAMFIIGVVNAWIPSYLTRYYGLAPDKAALQAGIVVLVAGVGMIACGWGVDRLSRLHPRNKLRVPAVYAVAAFALLTTAFVLPPGDLQYALILVGVFVAGGHCGAAGAVISEVTHPGLRATALAVLVLGNNLLGFAPGPVLVGVVSDAIGLKAAMTLAPVVCLLAATFFLLGARHYERERGRFDEPADDTAPMPAGH